MGDKIYEPARHNEKAPAEGMAAVNTHMPEETPLKELSEEKSKQNANKNEERNEAGSEIPAQQ
jgi:hypothetical protein